MSPPQPHPSLIRFINTDIPALIKLISAYLTLATHRGDLLLLTLPPLHPPTSKFQAQSKPTINTHDYLSRLINLCPLSIDGVLLGLVYLQRLTHLSLASSSRSENNNNTEQEDLIPINSLTIHRLMLSSMILGTKFISDRPLLRKRLSKVAGISERELDHLERELLTKLDFKLCWSNDELIQLTRNILTYPKPPIPISTQSSPSLPSTVIAATTTPITVAGTTTTITKTNASHRASFSTTITPSDHPATSPINALLRRHSTSRGLVFVKSQFIDSNLLSEKYGFSTDIHHSRSSSAQVLDNLIDNPLLATASSSSASSPSSKPRSTSKILVTRLEHNQIKICHAQVF
ncbi:hypothetical protein PCANC_04775 [Puccinia coronata f. sp. avenae]|uniref:Cyclin N-terminal domain-containing protein n=1 Tax=Puccinia coronata f. sp. avenae TaxID=200324 RepID=A0A2N5VWP1_9BASI|nr:hypothetical protein PCASD_15385 [Puccinia coronata f. sp. avenae]PLW50000.1 hypothetical protein PCASD_01354 [Puccinia coronata f. sp. avenae]PLW54405.1 hypothetical protein PCANC_04775 [Puccinia coronata f. sp. avenae]